jgi:hypothetical protein
MLTCGHLVEGRSAACLFSLSALNGRIVMVIKLLGPSRGRLMFPSRAGLAENEDVKRSPSKPMLIPRKILISHVDMATIALADHDPVRAQRPSRPGAQSHGPLDMIHSNQLYISALPQDNQPRSEKQKEAKASSVPSSRPISGLRTLRAVSLVID